MHKKEESVDRLIQIEVLFQKALDDLRTRQYTDVDFEYLDSMLDIYVKFYEPDESNIRRWDGYLEELSKLVHESRASNNMMMSKLVNLDKPMKAYQKAVAAAKLQTDEGK